MQSAVSHIVSCCVAHVCYSVIRQEKRKPGNEARFQGEGLGLDSSIDLFCSALNYSMYIEHASSEIRGRGLKSG